MTSLLWFQDDLRLADHPALSAAIMEGGAIVPVYVYNDSPRGGLRRGSAARSWLRASLASLDRSLRERDSRLTIRAGAPEAVLTALAAECDASTVFAIGGGSDAATREVHTALGARGVELRRVGSRFLVEPSAVYSGKGRPYRTFTSFERPVRREIGALVADEAPPCPLAAPARWPHGINDEQLALETYGSVHSALQWQPGEAGARACLQQFIHRGVDEYSSRRNRPDLDATSRLSPHLAFGEIASARVWTRLARIAGEGAEAAQRQLLWREFAWHLMAGYPHMIDEPIEPRFRQMAWREAPAELDAWKHGMTGYPLVDAGMRQLAAIGWVHNRARMVAGSFLVKHLLISWIEGEEWYWENLVDADAACNAMNWQWVAGCGADAAPFFRIFNPVLQGEKFDPDGSYVRRWVPELSGLPNRWVHRPWEAPPDALVSASVRLGVDYPRPMVDHSGARERALTAYRAVRLTREHPTA